MYMTKDMFESTPADQSVKDPKVRVNVNSLQSRYIQSDQMLATFE